VERRTRLIIKLTATAVVIVSVVLARQISDGDVARFGIAQAALFFAFGISSIVLFAFVVTDFDRWTETVPPVPKRLLRRSIGRVTRRMRRAGEWTLAASGAAMVWFWSRVGGAIGTGTVRSARGVARFWMWILRGLVRGLVVYGTVMDRLWATVGHVSAWTLVRSGAGLTVAWAWAVRGGVRALVVYGTVMDRLWATVGHVSAWTSVRSGAGLTVAWAWAVRGGVRALVLYRGAMQWLWSIASHAARWAAIAAAAALRVLWAGVGRGLAWTLRQCRSGLRRAWLAVAGRGDEPTPKPIRRWYKESVDAAFGIPPDGTSVDELGGRVAPAGRERRTSEKVGVGARPAPEGTDDDAVL
jgi:hypothetical protein